MSNKTKKFTDSYYYDGRNKKWIIENIVDYPIPSPTKELIHSYINKWENTEEFTERENALNKLFFTLCPKNEDLDDILIKVCALNDFYNTNIYDVREVALVIKEIDFDNKIKSNVVNPDLVIEIEKKYKEKISDSKGCYSFATKYCSHHRPELYSIYDSYVSRLLCYFRDNSELGKKIYFTKDDLRNYKIFNKVLVEFKTMYGLEKYNAKEIDKLLWQMGKHHFPNYTKEREYD